MFIYALLIINLILVIIYMELCHKNKQKLLVSLFFLFLPIIGFIIYMVANVVIKIVSSKLYDRQSLVHRYKFDDEVHTPDINKELNIIPIGDAMYISNNNEKRKLLLEQLKNGVYKNYKNILIASNDDDSETAHYVASAKMEVYNRININLRHAIEMYEKKPDDESNIYSMLNGLINIIESNLLSKNECNIYIEKYCNIFKEYFFTVKTEKNEENINFFEMFIKYSVQLEEYEFVMPVFDEIPEEYKNENMYIQVLKMFYNTNQKDNFKNTLDKLCNSSIAMSNDGIDIVRFWLKERN